jgi:cysteine desulfurase
MDPHRFLDAVGEEAAVAALMYANHEVGAVMPVAEVAEGLQSRGIPLLCDASLAPGRLDVAPDALGADLVLFSGHKFNGPRGSGVLYVRRGTRLARWMRGGLQEERLRPGTENVAACVALAVALEEAESQRTERASRYSALVDAFLTGLADLDGWARAGPERGGLPGLLALELHGVEGEAVMINMDLEGFAISTGSACALGSTDPSPGLLAMGFTKKRAATTVRLSVGEGTTEHDIARAASTLSDIVERLRALSRRR